MNIRIYTDMVGDLFHWGHVNFLRRAKQYGTILVVGVHSDKAVESYKRTPILNMMERIKVIEACKYVDEIIPSAPLSISKEYLSNHKIDKVITVNNRPPKQIEMMYSVPRELKILILIPYTEEISTTMIIERIKDR